MATINQIRMLLRKQRPVTAGIDGEKYAMQWLQNNEWDFESVEQGVENLSEKLHNYGGKRPDFIAKVKEDDRLWILLDAKYHSTENCSSFILTEVELNKYRALRDFLKENFNENTFEVIFMLFPKEKDGTRLVFVGLDEFDSAECTTYASSHARKVSLCDRDDLWFDHSPTE